MKYPNQFEINKKRKNRLQVNGAVPSELGFALSDQLEYLVFAIHQGNRIQRRVARSRLKAMLKKNRSKI